MALIIYPLDSWDSFQEVAECTTLSNNYISGNKFASLADDTAREIVLRQTALQIKQCSSITLPDLNELDLLMAQMYLVEQALTVDMIAYDSNDRAITEEHAGAVGVSYDSNKKASSANAFPPMVNDLLRQYGCTKSGGGFSQSFIGRG